METSRKWKLNTEKKTHRAHKGKKMMLFKTLPLTPKKVLTQRHREHKEKRSCCLNSTPNPEKQFLHRGYK